eukprot:TRINITY_DN24361_c0_g2_i1.p1 TRINITY_DN24361_c0_g2~~TRINITY_DN24361_c0_g2_i1.p1  ORF type:complete len:3364 (+),score=509.29 TRINITY_DN24361_c0_g2_i1:80-10171(+)
MFAFVQRGHVEPRSRRRALMATGAGADADAACLAPQRSATRRQRHRAMAATPLLWQVWRRRLCHCFGRPGGGLMLSLMVLWHEALIVAANTGASRAARESREADASETAVEQGLRAEGVPSGEEASRRLVAVGVEFSVGLVENSNIRAEPKGLNVNVRAGVTYPAVNVHASGGLGTSKQTIRAKLVPYDMRSTLKTCATVDPYMGFPFNGAENSVDQGITPETILNVFSAVTFPNAGLFRLCYSPDGNQWQELAPSITVWGSESSTNKFWCPKSSLKREICKTELDTIGCECKGQVEGYKRNNVTDDFMALGLPNPAWPTWKASLTYVDQQCGGTVDAAPFTNKVTSVENYLGYEIHNFGNIVDGKDLGVWKVCYCVGFDFDNGAGTGNTVTACASTAPQDFPQTIGQLVVIDVQSLMGEAGSTDITVYPTLRFGLVINCGHDGVTNKAPESISGGCSISDTPRYKIIQSSTESDKPYYDADAGCRFMPQARTYTDNAKIWGGHLGPPNCVGPSTCNDLPEKVVSGKAPTFLDVQIDPNYENGVMTFGRFDVCYCDSDCLNSMYWFKAGTLEVEPVVTRFTSDYQSGSYAENQAVVNTGRFLAILGLGSATSPVQGSWSSESDGPKTREMKLLNDDDGNVDKAACLDTAQPTVISGHRLVSGNTDYTEPQTVFEADDVGRPRGQLYGKVCDNKVPQTCAPSIRISLAGWYAVCYCDSNCNEVSNWAVFGRQLVAGPKARQSWTRYTGVTFSIDVEGYDLKITNRALILSTSQQLQDCGNFMSTTRVDGPKATAYLHTWATSDAKMTAITWSYLGTEIAFGKSHGLKDGDRVRLTGVNVEAGIGGDRFAGMLATKRSDMFNTVHEVFVACDDDATSCWKILIPVKFLAAEFPLIQNIESVIWVRTSKETFRGIMVGDGNESPEGRGYPVCWCNACEESDSNYPAFVGQAGTITVKKPLSMPLAALGLTTVMPDVNPPFNGPGGPVVIAFRTGDIASYAVATGNLHLVIEIQPGLVTQGADRNQRDIYADVLLPRTNNLQPLTLSDDKNEPSEADQAFCGRLFLELWSEDEDGFPMPDGCYYSEDTTNPDKRVKQLHIIFTERNHLKKNTKYMVVTNMNILKELDKDFPGEGAIWIWSMDDVYNNPFGVIERGTALPSPKTRVPPRDSLRNLLLNQPGDPRFFIEGQAPSGFVIDPTVLGANGNTKVQEVFSYCIPHDEKNPTTTPSPELQCQVCRSEEDCGNGERSPGFNILPDPSKSYCRSPIDTKCINADASNWAVFDFRLKAKLGSPIKPQSILRLFMHPLTQWDMAEACEVRVKVGGCRAPSDGGECSTAICQSESVVGGQVVGISEYPVNIMKITLPNIMRDVTNENTLTMQVGSMPLPPGGFFPQVVTAELMKNGETAPDYWDMGKALAANGEQGSSARLYKSPLILAASIVTAVGDGNSAPFRGDKLNKLYVRLVFGTTFQAGTNGVEINFKLPFGYVCETPTNGGPVPNLNVLKKLFPSTRGRLGGRSGEVRFRNIPATPTVMCRLTLLQDMIIYARTVYFVELTVNNPSSAMKRDDPLNYWNISVTHNDYNPAEVVTDIQLSNQQLRSCPTPRTKLLCLQDMGTDYSSGVSVLGKLTDFFIAPSNFGVGQTNRLSVFFMTEQEVGDPPNVETELWLDAPSGFDFGQYCAASELESIYYIPEGRGTSPLPTGQLIACVGAPSADTELTYNRAKVSTTGRLLRATFYGFRVQVTNAPIYVRTQLNAWRLWTYVKATGFGVDGTYTTARVNEKVPAAPDASWGMYARQMGAASFQISFSTVRPTVGASPADITILPIMVAVVMDKAVRITAPAGYEWDFEQVEFRYQAPASGVNPLNIVPGAQADIPISGKPARPNSEPKNVLTMDYMQQPWTPGVIYGLACKIRIPMVPPTGSANQFTIEFGYNEDLHDNRLEAGVFKGPMVQRLINGVIGYTTSVMGRKVDISFAVQTVTTIPEGGGLVIIGPPNFIFERNCQPKPATNFPELPYDSTCLFAPILATGQPKIDIIAGPVGIPATHYKFTLAGTNPPQAVVALDAGSWTILSFSLISEQLVLDQNTTINSFAVAMPMVSAKLIAHPKTDCIFVPVESIQCDFELWDFYPPMGYRDDRPLRQSQLIIEFQLSQNVINTEVMLLRAPVGYEFDAECSIVTSPSARIFNDTAYNGILPRVGPNMNLLPKYVADDRRTYAQRFDIWPPAVTVPSCLGAANEARITFSAGLQTYKRYLFRLSVAQNPAVTPEYNFFVLEYNGEASEPFKGVDIWAFTNTTILPTTTAASRADYPTENKVTIMLRPVNDIPNGGHLRVEAPSAFVVPTNCEMSLQVHQLERPNISAYPTTEQSKISAWSEYNPGDIVCEGDVTASSRGRLKLPAKSENAKYIKGGVLYVLTLKVMNPQTTSRLPEEWRLHSYKDMTVKQIIDERYVPGFAINTAVQSFAYLKPESTNAGVKQRLDFNISFPDVVAIGDTLTIVAPVSYFFSEQGDSRCPRYVFLDGAMTKTMPVCSANIITWKLEDESIPKLSAIRFMAQVRNPPETPSINLFQVKQTDVNGTVRSSRMIAGYEIIPELNSPKVMEVPPLTYCRNDVAKVTGLPCQGTGSRSSAMISFIPTRAAGLVSLEAHVNGDYYNFIEATFPDYTFGAIPIRARSSQVIVAVIPVHSGQPVSFRVDNVLNPMTPGTSKWSVATYIDGVPLGMAEQTTVMPVLPCTDSNGECGLFPITEARRDEKLNLASMPVLGYLRTMTSSSINPIYYRTAQATATFELRGETAHGVNDVLRITRPSGYTLLPSTLRGLTGVSFGENGLDFMRVWSQNFDDPEDYYGVLTQPIPASTTFRFQIQVSSPIQAEKVLNWYFRTYRVQPSFDQDGDIVDASMPAYPWIGRAITITGTNDGAFGGFLLVGQVERLRIAADQQTPGAEIKLEINFHVSDGVQATQYVRMEVTAPEGFIFADACLTSDTTGQVNFDFSKCTGFRNQASLVTVLRQLRAKPYKVTLRANNPGITPSPNKFYVSIFEDDSTQYVRWSEVLGYEIQGMGVVYKGNNQLGELASGFFTFTPVKDSPSSVLYIVITPPPNSGFRLRCEGVSPLGFVFDPSCRSGDVNEPMTLRFQNASLVKNKAYTIGVRVYNPGGRPNELYNYWGISLQNHIQQTFDANLRVPGLRLTSVRLRCNGLGWQTSRSGVLGTVLIQLRVLHTIEAGIFQKFVIRAPEGIMYNEDPSTVQVLPFELPLRLAIPTQVAGDTLTLYLDENSEITVGTYNIRFEASNPTVYPHDNTWSILAMKDIVVEFSHVETGYVEGQESPLSINAASALPNSFAHRRASSGMGLGLALVLFAVSMLWPKASS